MQVSEKIRDLVISCDGGIGKTINSTAVVREVKKRFPKINIHVITGHHDVYIHNQNIRKLYNFGNPLYFYEDYFERHPEETLFLREEPYLSYEYYAMKEHIVSTWCKQLDIECDSIRGDLFFTVAELDAARSYLHTMNGNGEKPLVLLQWVGGKVPEKPGEKEYYDAVAQMYRRSLPKETAQKIVNELKELGYVVGVIGHPNFPKLENAEHIYLSLRHTLALINFCHTFIGIDSFVQHAAATHQINKKGIVCWGGTNPKKLGYDLHINLTREVCSNPFCHRPNTYLFDTHNGQLWSCPHSEKCMNFDVKEIMDTFKANFHQSKKNKKELKNVK